MMQVGGLRTEDASNNNIWAREGWARMWYKVSIEMMHVSQRMDPATCAMAHKGGSSDMACEDMIRGGNGTRQK